MKTHTVEGQFLLDRVGGLLGRIGEVVRSCHERWDGKGYPDGLKGEQIPLAARIVFVCDAYNAMTTDRPYRKAHERAAAMEELQANAGTQFDPTIVTALIEVVEDAEPEGRAADDMRLLLSEVRFSRSRAPPAGSDAPPASSERSATKPRPAPSSQLPQPRSRPSARACPAPRSARHRTSSAIASAQDVSVSSRPNVAALERAPAPRTASAGADRSRTARCRNRRGRRPPARSPGLAIAAVTRLPSPVRKRPCTNRRLSSGGGTTRRRPPATRAGSPTP